VELLFQGIWVRKVLGGLLVENGNEFLRGRWNRYGTLADDGFRFDFLVVDLFVGAVVWPEAGAFEREAGK